MNDFEAKLRKVPLAPPPANLDGRVAAALEHPPRRPMVLALALGAVGLIVAGYLFWPTRKPALPSLVVVPMSPELRAVLCPEPAPTPSYFQQPRTHIEWITPKGDQTI
jgi:hypothetical protein